MPIPAACAVVGVARSAPKASAFAAATARAKSAYHGTTSAVIDVKCSASGSKLESRCAALGTAGTRRELICRYIERGFRMNREIVSHYDR